MGSDADERARARASSSLRALDDADETVRQAAAHSASVWRDAHAVPALLRMLAAGSAHNRRAAAEALGQIGDRRAVPALLDAANAQADRFLEHSITFALLEIGDAEETAKGLGHAEPTARRAAMIALDQMGGDKLAVGRGGEGTVVAARRPARRGGVDRRAPSGMG